MCYWDSCILPPVVHTHTLYSVFWGLLTHSPIPSSPIFLPFFLNKQCFFPSFLIVFLFVLISLPLLLLPPLLQGLPHPLPLLLITLTPAFLSVPNSFHLLSTTLPLFLSLSESDCVEKAVADLGPRSTPPVCGNIKAIFPNKHTHLHTRALPRTQMAIHIRACYLVNKINSRPAESSH